MKNKKPIFKVIIAGGRKFNDYNLLKNKLDTILAEKRKTHQIYIISGMAKGADTLGERYANENNFTVLGFPAEWNLYGKSAGIRRNEEMAKVGDALIAFWDGESPGTKHMIETAKDKRLLVRVIKY
jgi:hypothetical protein